MAMPSVGRVAEETRLMRGFAKAAIAEATPKHSQVESQVASLATEAEVTTSCVIGAMSQRLEHELETVASGTVTVSMQNTRVAIEGLCTKLQAKFDKDRAELQQQQLKTQGQMNEISTSIE